MEVTKTQMPQNAPWSYLLGTSPGLQTWRLQHLNVCV